MAGFQVQDIDPMLAQLGEPVTIAGVTANAVVRVPDEELMRERHDLAPLIGKLYEVICKLGAFPGLVIGVTVTRGAETYKVREFLQVRDGQVVHVLCAIA